MQREMLGYLFVWWVSWEFNIFSKNYQNKRTKKSRKAKTWQNYKKLNSYIDLVQNMVDISFSFSVDGTKIEVKSHLYSY